MPELLSIIEKIDYSGKYHEPFVGGGALLFEVLNRGQKVGTINDLNRNLIDTYHSINNDLENLVVTLKKLEKNHTRFSYYDIRDMDRDGRVNKISTTTKSARFIYLNKMSFNGLYRVNSKDEFNVPIGTLWGKSIFSYDNLRKISDTFSKSKIKIHNESYEYILEQAKSGDLVYFDPPYDSFENENNFVGYQKEGFDRKDQEELRDVCNKLIDMGVNVILSNHNTKFIIDLYKDDKYYIQKIIDARRMLNSDSTKRSKKPIEIIIYGGKDVKKN